MSTKEDYMRAALSEAEKAYALDEVPVGAVIVSGGAIIASSYNKKESQKCALKHAEMLAIEHACAVLDSKYLDGCDMYVTLEPCPMCAGAIINARLRAVYYGAKDLKAGSCGTLYNLVQDMRFNHNCEVEGDVLKDECGQILSRYFRGKRYDRELKREQAKAENTD